MTVIFEGLRRHDGPQVGAADTDINDIFDGFTAVAEPLPAANLIAKIGHFLEDGPNFRHDVVPVGHDWLVGLVTQSGV